MKALLRPICWLSDHRWRITRSLPLVAAHLGHLHHLAGCDADCERCGEEWRDFEHFNRWPWTDDNEAAYDPS